MQHPTQCPNCGARITGADSSYDPSDPIQKRGYDDQKWNEARQTKNAAIGGYRRNEYLGGSSEYYRWNRGARHAMGI